MRNSSSIGAVALGLLLAGLGMGVATRAAHAATLVAKPVLRQASEAGGGQAAQATQDVLIFKNQRVLSGKIVSETPDVIVFKAVIAGGIELSTEYRKSEILKINRGVKVAASEAAVETAATPTPRAEEKAESPADSAGKKRVYIVNLVGEFGEEISEIPLRDAVKDAVRSNADVIVFKLNNKWEFQNSLGEKIPDELGEFDGMRRAEELMPIFRNEIPEMKSDLRVVFWVEQAMGGAAFLPFLSKEIYFTGDARMGGIGDLGELFEGRGDDVVRQKQRSLRLGHAKGIANVGGYDPRIIEAMAVKEYVLSVSYENGVPKLLERMPENPGETLLTDDGKGINIDTLEQRVANKGNDVLTLTAKIASDIGVSKGTADTRDELLFRMGLDRIAYMIPEKQGETIMKGFATELYNVKQRLKRIMEDLAEIPQGNNYQERTASRGRRIRLINGAIFALNRYGNAISPQWRGENKIPGVAQFEQMKAELEREQLGDRRGT